MAVKRRMRARYKYYFYRMIDSKDDFGEPSRTPVGFTSGFCEKQKAKSPIEIVDASTPLAQSTHVLITRFTKQLLEIPDDSIAFCPALDEVLEVVGEPIDFDGTRRYLHIYVVNNTRRFDADNRRSLEKYYT